MKETRILMGMPVTVEILDAHATQSEIDKVFDYFRYVDEKFSTYKDTSEIMAINRGELAENDWSEDVKEVFRLSEETKAATDGYFDIRTPLKIGPAASREDFPSESRDLPTTDMSISREGNRDLQPSVGREAEAHVSHAFPPSEPTEKAELSLKTPRAADSARLANFERGSITPKGSYDPSGMVKGWAIWNAAKILRRDGFEDFYVDAGGDIQPHGRNAQGGKWSIGIRNPFKADEIVKTVYVYDEGVATSGTYIRGEHIYNPKEQNKVVFEIVSLTVIGPNIYEADRFATAAFAMGARGIHFIEKLSGFEAYMINKKGIATMTSGFEKYTLAD